MSNNQKQDRLFDADLSDLDERRKAERAYVKRLDKERHYVPVETDWITPSLGNFS